MKTKSLNTSALVTADSPKGQRATETFRAQYNKAGLTEESAQILNENPGFATYLLAGIKRFSVKAPDYELVRTILGKDFISPEDVMNSRKGITYTDEQVAQFRKTVPVQEILEWCRDNNFMLVAGPNRPMSLLEILRPMNNARLEILRQLLMDNTYLHPREYTWYYDQKFAQKDKVETKWYMIRKDPVPESTFKNWEEQQLMISDVETVPNSAEFTWAITTYKVVREVCLFNGICVRTSSLYLDGNHVSVGNLSEDFYLEVNIRWGNNRRGNLGFSVARK